MNKSADTARHETINAIQKIKQEILKDTESRINNAIANGFYGTKTQYIQEQEIVSFIAQTLSDLGYKVDNHHGRGELSIRWDNE